MIFGRSRRSSGYAAVSSGGRDAESRRKGHWGATRALAGTMIAAAALIAVAPALLAAAAPVGQAFGALFWTLLLSIGPPIGFVALVFAFAASQDAIDRAYRVSEAD